jgi:phage gpG-like protein
VELRIITTGDKAAAARLHRLGQKARFARPILTDIVDEIIEIQQDRWRKGRFKKLAPSTLARKRREGQDPRPLRASGALMRSLTEDNAPNQTKIVRDDYLVFGTTLYYARFHNIGKGVPKRKPLDITPRQREPLVQRIMDFLTE